MRHRILGVALAVFALGAGCDEAERGRAAVAQGALIAALTEATSYPTAHVVKIAKRGALFEGTDVNAPWPMVLYGAASARAFEIEVLEGDALDGRLFMAGLLDDAKRERGALPTVASMLTADTIRELAYDTETRRGTMTFVVGGRFRLRGMFKTEGSGEEFQVVHLRLPDSGWGASRRADGTWKMFLPLPPGPGRGIYGGIPTALMEDGKTLAEAGVTGVWIGERGITTERIRRLRDHQVGVFAEFNTMHRAEYLKDHPGAAPVGPDGNRAEAPHGWQGVCPTHEGYRTWRMDAFRKLITEFAVDGVWLDYHHAHASWERADPVLPDTCFCPRCLAAFQNDTGMRLGDKPVPELSKRLLGELRDAWVDWRCAVFTDWVQEFDTIRTKARRKIALSSFHCPWTEEERSGALRAKLAIDLRAQSRYLDVLSPMPYHARFGHAKDPAWISRQVAWLAGHLGLKGPRGEHTSIQPIVQLSDWGEKVPVEQIPEVLEHGLRPPSRGVIVFAWGGIKDDPKRLEAMTTFFKSR